jgi:hypothetical protein
VAPGIFPLFHTGRPWRAFYWLFPIPNTDLNLWQNFPQPADLGRVRGHDYFTVSLLFWFTGLVPDLATLRDRATDKGPAGGLRHSEPGLARIGAALAALRAGLPDSGGHFDAAGAQRPLGG